MATHRPLHEVCLLCWKSGQDNCSQVVHKDMHIMVSTLGIRSRVLGHVVHIMCTG